MEEYLSCNFHEAVLEIEKSVFVAAAAHVRSEEEAMRFIEDRRKLRPDATHHCYAFLCGENLFRFSDAGEPSRTAGMPILEAIRGRGLTNTAVVVTRYFGGVKLGAGGLARAYSKAALAAVDGGGTLLFERAVEIETAVGYELFPRIERFLRNRGGPWEREFSEQVLIRFPERAKDAGRTIAALTDLAGGNLRISRRDAGFVHFTETNFEG